MKQLYKYVNGNYTVTLFEDGTKMRETNEKLFIPDFPESIDTKITEYCDNNCSFCYEDSNINGKHANIHKLLEVFNELPSGVEIAIGGGNPLAHPELITFLEKLKEKGFIPNITINQNHIDKYFDLIKYIIKNRLVYGVGISIAKTDMTNIEPLIKLTKNIVFHLISGVHPVKIVSTLKKFEPCKILLLGYKNKGRGCLHTPIERKKIMENASEWKKFVPLFINTINLAFDNLAIQQLQLKKLISKDYWDLFYMGDDFEFTMFVDGVKEEYGPSSTSEKRISFSKISLLKFFNIAKDV